MNFQSFIPIIGIIRNISQNGEDCCSQMLTLISEGTQINVVVNPSTFVVDNVRLRRGMRIVFYYDPNKPMPMIYPPRHQAELISVLRPNENVYLGLFAQDLVSGDGSLKLNIEPSTVITTNNGQKFDCNPGGHTLLVFYTVTTRSIPPQTTPRRILVFC